MKSKIKLEDTPRHEMAEALSKALANIVRNMQNKTGSTADLTRVLHMQIELGKTVDTDDVREIRVTWVEPAPSPESQNES